MIAITGASGLLGGHIIEKFVAEGVPCVAICRNGNTSGFPAGIEVRKADVLDQVSLKEAFTGITTVVHAAGFVSFNPRRSKNIFMVNVEGTRNVVDMCLHQGIDHLIHISSVAALGRKPGEITSEETKWTGLMASDYAMSKYMAELEVFRGAEEGLKVALLNPSVVLSAARPERSSAALFNYVWNSKKFYTAGSLNYVDARDVAAAVYQLYQRPEPGEKFILSAGSIPYRDFFSKVAQHFDRKAPSVKISSSLAYWAGLLDEMRGWVLNREPTMTRQAATMAMQSFQYENKKARERLDLQFRTLEESILWCCEDFKRNVKTNK